MGRLDKLPGIDGSNTKRRNVVVGGLYALAGCVTMSAIGGDGNETEVGETENDVGTENDENAENGSDNDREGISELYVDALGEQGLTTTVSESGEHIGYGLQTGDLLLYDADGDSRLESFAADRDVSHLAISDEHDRFVLAWMDMHTFGGGTLDREAQWAFEYTGLWDIAMTPDLNTVAASTAPFEGAGGVGLVVEGEMAWTEGMDDATGIAIDIDNNGDNIVVGGAHVWEGEDRDGTPGVYYYDSEGTLEWTHETEEDVIAVGLDADEDLVVAGTDDGLLLAFDREGDIRWENDDGGFVDISGDGSTIVCDTFGEVIAFDSDGEVQWRESVESWGSDFEVSSDGDRVIVGARGDGVATVLDDGDTIWTASWDVGPVQVALSEDGQTWSVIVRDNDEELSYGYGYREYL